MISRQNLSKLIESLASEGDSPEKSSVLLVDFFGKYGLSGLLLNATNDLMTREKLKKNQNCIFVRVRDEKDIKEEILEKIKSVLSVPSDAQVSIETDKNIKAGFIASYNGMIFDARVESLAKKMTKKLKESVN